MSILNYNTVLQSNNTDLQAILDAVNELPESGVIDDISRSIIEGTIEEVFDRNITTIDSYAFYRCSSLTSVSFPACTSIGNNAFYYCFSLTTASFPACATIGCSAFYGCSKLTSVNFPACATIGSNVFYGCSSLTTVSFPACTSIDSYAFISCLNLESLYITGSILCTLSNSNAFTGTKINSSNGSIYVPASLLISYQTATNWTYFSSRFVGI